MSKLFTIQVERLGDKTSCDWMMETLKLTVRVPVSAMVSDRLSGILGQLAAGLVDIEFWEVAELGEDVPPILAAQGD